MGYGNEHARRGVLTRRARGVKRVSMPNNNGGAAGSILFGTHEQVGVGRGLAEFRAGRPVVVKSGSETLLCLPVEGRNEDRLMALRALCGPVGRGLVLAGGRAGGGGVDAD